MSRPEGSAGRNLVLVIALGSACTTADDGGDDASNSAGEESGDACDLDEDCENGVCDPATNLCSELGCDPEDQEIGPEPRDQPGEVCCTEKPGCSGYDRNGQPINPLYVGQTLACVGGVWVEDPDYCDPETESGVPLLGCVWDSTQGDFVKPQCVYQ